MQCYLKPVPVRRLARRARGQASSSFATHGRIQATRVRGPFQKLSKGYLATGNRAVFRTNWYGLLLRKASQLPALKEQKPLPHSHQAHEKHRLLRDTHTIQVLYRPPAEPWKPGILWTPICSQAATWLPAWQPVVFTTLSSSDEINKNGHRNITHAKRKHCSGDNQHFDNIMSFLIARRQQKNRIVCLVFLHVAI